MGLFLVVDNNTINFVDKRQEGHFIATSVVYLEESRKMPLFVMDE